MADAKDAIQGSNAKVAEGGLNPEAAFAAATPGTDHRMAMEAETQQQGAGQMLRNVRRQMERSPGGKGAAFGRNEYETR